MKTDRTPFQIRWRLERDKAFKERFYDKYENDSIVKQEIPKNGPHTEYYENGLKKSEKSYKNGQKHGKVRIWFESGQIWQLSLIHI